MKECGNSTRKIHICSNYKYFSWVTHIMWVNSGLHLLV